MADARLENDRLAIKLSLRDQLLAFHGSFHIPLSHVTNAYVSSLEDLELEYRPLGTGMGFVKSAGIFANPHGLIFCDLTGESDCLVIETRGERFPRIAVTLAKNSDPNALAHEICRRIPSSGD